MTTFTGTTGDDTFEGAAGADTYDLSQGGEDTASGGAGKDIFEFGATFSAGDQIDGGADLDILEINGDYAAPITFAADHISSVERVTLVSGHDYDLVIGAGLIQASQQLTVFCGGAGDSVSIDNTASAEGTQLQAESGGGSFTFRGGAGKDLVSLTTSTITHLDVDLGAGDDRINIWPNLPGGAHLAGGDGTDMLILEFKPPAPLTLNTALATGFEIVEIDWGGDIRISDNFVTAGGTLTVYASTIPANGYAHVDGSKVKHGALNIVGGTVSDTLAGGHGADSLFGAGGSDTLIGNGGADHIDASDATGDAPDTIVYLSTRDSTKKAADLLIVDNATIDLSAIDADTTLGGDQAFTVVAHFDHHAGELAIAYKAKTGLTTISLDVDGDGKADSVITIQGDHHAFTDFVL